MAHSLAIAWVFFVVLTAGARADAHDCGDPPFSIAQAQSSAVAVSEGPGSAHASSSAVATSEPSSPCPPDREPPSFPDPPSRPTESPSFPSLPSFPSFPSSPSAPDDTEFEPPPSEPDTTESSGDGSSGSSGDGSSGFEGEGSSGPDFDPGFSDGDGVSEVLRKHIENANIEGVARTLDRSNNIEELAEGFRFDEDEREEALEKTESRVNDGDVVSIKGIAKSAFRTGDVDKLARVMVKSVEPEEGDYPVDTDALIEELKEVLSDRKVLARIIAADPKEELNRRLAARRLQRKLTCNKCTPANSYVCAHCWPGKVCKKFWWC